MSNFTASALPRGFVCLASLVHPQRDYRTADAEAGNDRHAKRETELLSKDYAELPPEIAERLETYNNVTPEVAMAIDIATGAARIIGRSLQRKYGELAPFEIAGTTDVLAVDMDDRGRARRVLVGDWKGHDPEVEGPATNKQTFHNALCAARIFGVPEVEVFISRVGCAPRFATLDVFELDAFFDALRQLNLSAAAAGENPAAHEVEGSHCRYCNATAACTKKRALALEVMNGEASRRLDVLLPLETPDQAARALAFGEKLKQLVKRIEGSVRAWAGERPIPIGNGKMWGRVVEEGNEELDPDIVYEVVRETYGQAIADKAVHREAAKTWLKEALRAAGAKPLTKAEETVLDEIRKRAGVRRKPTEKWKEFPAPALKAVK